MATSTEAHIGNTDPESNGEFYNRPLADKVRSPMMAEYDRVRRENSERLDQRKSEQTPKGGNKDYRKEVKDFFEERRRAAEAESMARANKVGQGEEMDEETARKMAKSILRERGIGIDRIAAEEVLKSKKDEIESGAISEISVDLSAYDPSKSTEDYDLKAEINGALHDLEESDLSILKESGFKIVTKGKEVMYPLYMDDSNTLNVGFLNTGEDILNAIKNTVLPTLKEELSSGVNKSKTDEREVESDLNTGEVNLSDLSGLLPKDNVAAELQTENVAADLEVKEDPVLNQGSADSKSESIEEVLASTQLDNKENTQAWKTGEEWQRFERIRAELVKAEASAKKEKRELTDLERALQKQYGEYKDILATKIRGSIRQEMGEPTDDNLEEYKTKFDKESRSKIFEELVKGESDVYNKAIKEARGATRMDKVKEGVREILGTKAIQWYLGQSRAKRAAINTGLFAVAIGLGTFVGGAAATSALGAGAYRVVRGAASFGGATLGKVIGDKAWKVEDINKWKEAEEEQIKNSDESVEMKSKRLKDVNEEFGKRIKSVAMNKAVTTAALGAGFGVGAGLLDWAYSGTGGNITESLGKPKASQPEVQGGIVKEVTRIETPGTNLPEGVEPVQNIPKGGSLWGAMKSALEENDRFKALNSGQRNNLLAYYANKVIDDPKDYGFEPDSRYGVRLEPDKSIDLSKLFSDQGEFEKVMKRAENLAPKMADQMEKRTITIENLQKTGRVLTDQEVLNIEETSEVSLGQEVASIEPSKSSMEQEFFGAKKPEELVAENDIDSSSYNDTTDLHNEIKAAKDRLAELENNPPIERPRIVQMPSRQSGMAEPASIRSMQGDTRSLAERVNNVDTVVNDVMDPIQKAFVNEVQNVYGSEGFLGMGKVSGLASKEWGLMKGLNANEVVKYFTGDSEQTILPAKVAAELTKSAKHQAFAGQLLGLIRETEGNVKPFENENVEVYLKRLGKFVMEKHTNKSPSIDVGVDMKKVA